MKIRKCIAWLSDMFIEATELMPAVNPDDIDIEQAVAMNFNCVSFYAHEGATEEECLGKIHRDMFYDNWTANDSNSIVQKWNDKTQEWE